MKTLTSAKAILTVIFTLSLFVTHMGALQPANAQCAAAPEAGNWHNYNSHTNSITRIRVAQGCNDSVGIPVDSNGNPIPGGSGPTYGFGLHIWGACVPTDCDWGNIGANRDSTGWIRATQNVGYATKYIWVVATSGWLRVYVWTDFTAADGRTDYASDEWFLRD